MIPTISISWSSGGNKDKFAMENIKRFIDTGKRLASATAGVAHATCFLEVYKISAQTQNAQNITQLLLLIAVFTKALPIYPPAQTHDEPGTNPCLSL